MATFEEYVNATRPKPDDPVYANDPAAYVKALEDWSIAQNGGSMFQAPTDYTDPTTGHTFHAAGTNREESLPEYMANLLNTRYAQAQAHPGSATAKMLGLAMSSRAQVRPEEMQAAYKAVRSDGTQMLNPAMAAMLESYGVHLDLPPDSNGGTGVDSKGKPIPQPTPDMPYVVYDPKNDTYILSSTVPQQGSGIYVVDPATGYPDPEWINGPKTPAEIAAENAKAAYFAQNDPLHGKTPAQIAAENASYFPAGGTPNTGIFAQPSDTLDPANGPTADPTDKQLLGVQDYAGAAPDMQHYDKVMQGNYPDFIKRWYLQHAGMSGGPGTMLPVKPFGYQ
jgi:hypothetical protein